MPCSPPASLIIRPTRNIHPTKNPEPSTTRSPTASVDPPTANRQFCDQGSQYRTAIFYVNDRQKTLAEQSLKDMAARFDQPVVTEINPAGTFYPAEDYHQNYYEKNPLRYKFYRYGCGRDARLEELWGDDAGG